MAPLPSWEEIEAQASAAGYPASRRRSELLRSAERAPRSPAARGGQRLLLWRDDFGWCPFSQQAQLHLEEKGVAYQVKKVPLTLYRTGDRDQDFLRDSPEGLVPALRVLHSGSQQEPSSAVGSVALGAAGVRAFIEDFCEGPPLLRCAGVNHCMVKAYLGLAEGLEKQLHALLKAAVEAGLEPASAEKARAAEDAERFLLSTLEDVDLALNEAEDGPYFFGSTFSVVDIAFAPWVDRAAALLGWLRNRQVRGGLFPALDSWLVAMDARPAHRSLRLDDETVVRIAAASQPSLARGRPGLGLRLAGGALADEGRAGVGGEAAATGAEAAQCLAACRSGVAALAGRRAPKAAAEAVDRLLRAAALEALGGNSVANNAFGCEGRAADGAAELASAAVFVRSRLAVPRDMSAEAARRLRQTLEAAAVALVGRAEVDALLSKELAAYSEKVGFLSRY